GSATSGTGTYHYRTGTYLYRRARGRVSSWLLPCSAARRRRRRTWPGSGGGFLDLRLHGDLLAVGLGLDQRQHLLAVLVVELGRLELGRQRVDQLLGHLELPVGGLGLLDLADLVQAVRREHLV